MGTQKILFFLLLFILQFSCQRHIAKIEEIDFSNNGYNWLDTQTAYNSLSAKTCQGCHQKIYEQWTTSRHGKAWTNKGFQEGYELETQDRCIYCHAPLKVQYKSIKAKKYDSLVDEGVNCAACHIRDKEILPVGEKSERFHGSKKEIVKDATKLCMKCHQFNLNGTVDNQIVPLSLNAQSTYQEWQTYQYKGGKGTCITCHMPNGSHEFHGSYNKNKVNSALKFSVKRKDNKIEFKLKNIGAGHCVPTGDVFRNIVLEYNGKTVTEFRRFYKIHIDKKTGDISQVLEKNTCLKPFEERLIEVDFIAGAKFKLLYNYISKHHMSRTRLDKSEYQMIIEKGVTK